jgi:hypothetical protein
MYPHRHYTVTGLVILILGSFDFRFQKHRTGRDNGRDISPKECSVLSTLVIYWRMHGRRLLVCRGPLSFSRHFQLSHRTATKVFFYDGTVGVVPHL